MRLLLRLISYMVCTATKAKGQGLYPSCQPAPAAIQNFNSKPPRRAFFYTTIDTYIGIQILPCLKAGLTYSCVLL
jgi:hypothetical protein